MTRKKEGGGAGVAEPPPTVHHIRPEFGVRVGDVVYTIDRSRFVVAKERAQEPEPIAAIVARVLQDKDGQLTGMVCLMSVQPNGQPLDLLDVPYSDVLEPGHWTPRPGQRATIPMSVLVEAAKQALLLMGFTPPEAEPADDTKPTDEAAAGKPDDDATT